MFSLNICDSGCGDNLYYTEAACFTILHYNKCNYYSFDQGHSKTGETPEESHLKLVPIEAVQIEAILSLPLMYWFEIQDIV